MANSSPSKINFTAALFGQRSQHMIGSANEPSYYFRLPNEEQSSDPFQFWAEKSKTTLPNLARLARIILSIPGKLLPHL